MGLRHDGDRRRRQESGDDVDCGRVVVRHDEHLERRRIVLPGEGLQTSSQRIRTVSREDDHRHPGVPHGRRAYGSGAAPDRMHPIPRVCGRRRTVHAMGAAEPRSVDIVVATRHPGSGVTSLLRCIAASIDAPARVVVVRSGAPASAPRPRTEAPPGLDVIVVDVPEPGVAVARNVGLVVSAADIVCYLDDDVEPQPGWFPSVTRPFADPAVGLVGGSVVPRFPEGEPPRWLPAPLLETFYAARDASSTSQLPFGPVMAVRRRAALEVGGCPEGFGPVGELAGYHDETILGRRIVAAGWVAAEAAGAVVHHLVPVAHVRRSWLLRRAWAMGRSDARRDRLDGRAEPRRRAAKGLALVAASPFAALLPRTRWYVAARVAVNGGYLHEHVRSRVSWDEAEPSSPQDRSARATALG